jgi:hypothetical protein
MDILGFENLIKPNVESEISRFKRPLLEIWLAMLLNFSMFLGPSASNFIV